MDDFEMFCLALESTFGRVTVHENKTGGEESAHTLCLLRCVPQVGMGGSEGQQLSSGFRDWKRRPEHQNAGSWQISQDVLLGKKPAPVFSRLEKSSEGHVIDNPVRYQI